MLTVSYARVLLSKSVMVSVAVSELSYTNLIFVQPGAKITKAESKFVDYHMLGMMQERMYPVPIRDTDELVGEVGKFRSS